MFFKKNAFVSLTFFLIYFIPITCIYSQQSQEDTTVLRQGAVRVFLDVSRRYHNYVKTEIQFVNYVRDRKQAQVHILLTTQRTASMGTEYTITLIGQQEFANVNDTLKYVSKQMDTEEIIRKGIVRVLKMGLMQYVAETALADYISIIYQEEIIPGAVKDKWDYWVFNASTNGYFNGEESWNSFSIRGSFSADRVTPEWKISLDVTESYGESNFEIEDYIVSSITRSQSFRSLVVKSLSEHWSIGAYGSVSSSIYANNRFSINLSPAVEYNIFPYAQSTRREFRFLYRVGNTNVRYNEQTIFDKIRENLINESLSTTFEIKEKWGSVSSTIEGSHYFHDLSKNRLTFFSSLSLLLFQGLSLTLFGNASIIHDQLALPKEDVTVEEILLRRKQLATQYGYSISIGLRYTFGSIYSNVVNPRFESNKGIRSMGGIIF